jgi:hypothetical protein
LSLIEARFGQKPPCHEVLRAVENRPPSTNPIPLKTSPEISQDLLPECTLASGNTDRLDIEMFTKEGFEMEGAKFVISASGLANIPQSESRNDFEFIVGNARYRCSLFVADFLSPLLCCLHSVDGTVSSIRISTKDSNSQFGEFLSLGRCSSLFVALRH